MGGDGADGDEFVRAATVMRLAMVTMWFTRWGLGRNATGDRDQWVGVNATRWLGGGDDAVHERQRGLGALGQNGAHWRDFAVWQSAWAKSGLRKT